MAAAFCLLLPGCLATTVKLPPADETDLAGLIRECGPGEGGILYWNPGAWAWYDIGEQDAVIEALRATAVFGRIEVPTAEWHAEYTPESAHVRVDWVLTSGPAIVEDVGGITEIPFETLLTFGIIPSINTTRVTNVFHLSRWDGSGATTDIRIPGIQGEVEGLVSAAVVTIHPDWHMFAARTALNDRSRDRLVKGILRVIAAGKKARP